MLNLIRALVAALLCVAVIGPAPVKAQDVQIQGQHCIQLNEMRTAASTSVEQTKGEDPSKEVRLVVLEGDRAQAVAEASAKEARATNPEVKARAISAIVAVVYKEEVRYTVQFADTGCFSNVDDMDRHTWDRWLKAAGVDV
ncbi:MAG TPA: hypothetical protein VKQ30_20800 [Ktedonobacterales bacterium]|nr:hypothetical protein [Ktedonobacterales bacterium]